MAEVIEAADLTAGDRIRVTTGDGGQFIGTYKGDVPRATEADLALCVVNVTGERKVIPREVMELVQIEWLGRAS